MTLCFPVCTWIPILVLNRKVLWKPRHSTHDSIKGRAPIPFSFCVSVLCLPLYQPPHCVADLYPLGLVNNKPFFFFFPQSFLVFIAKVYLVILIRTTRPLQPQRWLQPGKCLWGLYIRSTGSLQWPQKFPASTILSIGWNKHKTATWSSLSFLDV